MKRVFGAVSTALRSLAPKASMPAVPHVAHQERVREAMESLAPSGRRLPSEAKALVIEHVEAARAGEEDFSLKTPEDAYQAANALFQVRPAEQRPDGYSSVQAAEQAGSACIFRTAVVIFVSLWCLGVPGTW